MNLDASSAIEQLMGLAGVHPDLLAHVHASPPCKTFAAPDSTNSSKDPPCNYRDPRSPDREPRAGPDSDPYRQEAVKHDKLVEHILDMLTEAKEKGANFEFSIENPRAALRRRPYMLAEHWPESIKAERKTVDYCAYGYPYRKSTDVWTSLLEWHPKGRTGSGRCERRCGQGNWTTTDTGALTFRHHVNLSQDPRDGLRGKGAKRVLNSLPPTLTEEILHASLHRWKLKGNRPLGKPVLLDLCAGYGSMRATAEKLGYTYVAVDITNLMSQHLSMLEVRE